MTIFKQAMPDDLQVNVIPFFDQDSNTFSYIVKDPSSQSCAVIDSVLDFDYASGSVSYTGADSIIAYIESEQLKVEWLLETHVHADHLSAAPYIQAKVGGCLAIGQHITTVQQTFAKIFNINNNFPQDGSQFDHLFADQDGFNIGGMKCLALHTPGHTPACMTYVIENAAFVGDTLFMPDAGTARVDFPGGDAVTLYESIEKILTLPEQTYIFMCHDYTPNGRELAFFTTVAEQQAKNIHIGQSIKKNDFITMRQERDKTLAMPRLILPSLQVNMRAGHFPEAEDNGLSYLKIPINAFKS